MSFTSMESEFSTPSSQAKISGPKLNPQSSGTNPPINPSSAFLVATFYQRADILGSEFELEYYQYASVALTTA